MKRSRKTRSRRSSRTTPTAEMFEPRQLLSAAAFGAPTAYGSGSSLGVVAVDLNGDGHVDVVSPNSASGGTDGVSVFLNTGAGALGGGVSYTTGDGVLTGFQPYALATADFNGDGHADIASANYASGTLSILLGDGNGALGNTTVYAAGTTPDGIAVDDLNGDSHPDVVVSNRGSNNVSVYLNNGDGTFAPAVSYNTDSGPGGVAIGDVSNDGRPDIVVADSNASDLTELVNDGAGAFTATTLGLSGNPIDVKIADMNADGIQDIVTGITGSSARVDVLLNNGAGFNDLFTSGTTSPVDLTIGDFNSDGHLDVASADSDNQSVDVQLGNGDGTLTAVQSFAAGLSTYSITSADLNGDNKPDLIAGSYSPGGSTAAFTTEFNAASGQVVTVPGMSNPWLAGQPAGFAEGNGDTAGAPPTSESPAPFPNGIGVTAGQVLTFSASGAVTTGGGGGVGPDGFAGAPYGHAPENGLAGSTVFEDGLQGVFITDAAPDPTVDPSTLPASLDFTAAPQRDYTAQTFALYQPFYIGTGVTSTGATRQITVPAGATRLFLGTTDLYGWFNNTGSFTVTVDGASATPATTPTKSIGGLDPNFGTNGLASHNVGFTSTSGVATDGTASVLIGPIGVVGSESFGVTRYLADGSLDTSFGTAGVTSTSLGSNIDAVPTSVKVLFGGDILVAGTATTYTDGVASGSEFAVAEYTPAGVLDASFGNGGVMLVGFSKISGVPSSDVLRSVAVSAGGTIYLGGSSDAAGAGNTDFAIASLTATGSLNTSFNSTGTALIDIGGGDDRVNSLAVQANNDVVVAGSGTVSGVAEIALARILPSGAMDKKFNRTGIVTDAVGAVYDSAASVVIQPKGQIVVGGLTGTGSASSPSSDFVVQRYTAAGKLDRTFAGGTVITSFGQPAAVTQLALQADGSVVASGKTAASLGDTLDVAVVRYTTKGALDGSFGTGGKTVIDLSSGVVASPALRRALAAAASGLGAAFDAFTSSLQGVVAVTEGGEILTAGNSGADTVEAELIAAGVDLVTRLLSALPASVLAGVKGKLSVTITETGTTVAKGAVTIAVSFATDAAGSNASTPVNFAAKVNLKQGQSKTFKLNFVYPTGLSSGAYFAVANVSNGAGVPDDLNANNNAAADAAAVTIAPAFITLAGSALSTGAVAAGKSVTISIDITNNGNVTAKGKTEIDFYLSPDATVAAGASLGVGAVGVKLPAGKSKTYKLKLAAPSALAAGTFNLLGVIDPNNNLGSGDASDALVIGATPVVVS